MFQKPTQTFVRRDNMRYGFFKRGMSGFLAALIMMYGIVPGRASAETVAASDYIQPADQISDTEPDADGQTTAPEQSETDGANTVSKVYRNGTILISSFEQLEQLGSGQLVKSRDNVPDKIGQGDPVLAEDGAYVTYALDGRYALTGDIAVPAGRMWQLPEGFTGEISPDFYVRDRRQEYRPRCSASGRSSTPWRRRTFRSREHPAGMRTGSADSPCCT